MQNLPHKYTVSATGQTEGNIELQSPNLPALVSAPPAEFGGPGDQWSPETLFVAAVADCFILTFRAIARASGFSWKSLECSVEGTLDKVERALQFTGLNVSVLLTVTPDTNLEQAQRLLEKAEHNCLITNSLKADSHLSTKVDVVS